MDQTSDLQDLNNFLDNITHHNTSQIFNFSETTALLVFKSYLRSMFTLHHPTTIILLCLYVLIFFISISGNTLVIFIIIKNPQMKRVKNLFLMNLAIIDLIVTIICIPLVVGQLVFRLWVYGTFMCKLTGYIQGVSVSSSIFTLCALSIDRYLTLKRSQGLCQIRSKSQAARILFIIWLLAAIVIAPLLYIRQVYVMEFTDIGVVMSYCIEQWPKPFSRKTYAIFLLFTTYIIPTIIITTCYSLIGKAICSKDVQREASTSSSTVMLSRKKVSQMMVALIGVFILCWLPYNIMSLDLDFTLHYAAVRVLPFTLWLGHAHSAVNPLLYWFLNHSFRHSMRILLRCNYCQSSEKHKRQSKFIDLGDILKLEMKHDVDDYKTTPKEPKVVCDLEIQTPSVKSNSSASSMGEQKDIQMDETKLHLDVSQKTSSSKLKGDSSKTKNSSSKTVHALMHNDNLRK